MADTNRVAKRDYFGMVRNIVDASAVENKADILSFINHEVELLDKKSGKNKETKTQKAHGAIKAAILEVLAERDKPTTISELMEDVRLQSYTEESKDGEGTVKMTNQKLTSMVTKLVKEQAVVRTEEKKVAYFSIKADESEDAESENE